MVWGAHLVPHPQVQRDQHMVDHVVDVHDITVTIKGRTILSNLSIQVEEGTFHGIIGPNGAGKTTRSTPYRDSVNPLKDQSNS